jgi:subtilisin family serine protease
MSVRAQEPQPFQTAAPAFAPDRVLVKFRSTVRPAVGPKGVFTTGQANLDRVLRDQGVQEAAALLPPMSFLSSEDDLGLSRIYRLQLPPGRDVLQAVAALSADPNVEYAEPDYIAQAAVVPNDPLLPGQWGLAKINATAAWDVVTGTATVVIAAVDSGIDLYHSDLIPKLWVNPGEIPGNGLDDDNNGYVDDVQGWNFVSGSNDVYDGNGHGTQVAGIIAAATNDSVGIAGLCWNCRLMPVRVMADSGASNYSDIAAGVVYATAKGARIINLSLGGYSDSHTLRDAINAAVAQGIVIVGGAGNDNVATPFYPAAYSNVLAVAGTTSGDTRAGYSNYGAWVDVAAPGVEITTTFLGGDWGPGSGTSVAAPFASGLAGLIRSRWPEWTEAMVRNQMMRTADNIDAANPGFAGQLGAGRLNAAAAMQDPHPILKVSGATIDGDAQGRPTPGQASSLAVTLSNDWWDATEVTGTLSTTDAYVNLANATASYGTIVAGGVGTSSPVYSFTVASGAGYNYPIHFTLAVTANAGTYSATFPLTITTRSGDEPVCGTIAEDTVWTNDKTYIVDCNVGVAPGYTLTIQAGTQVRFDGNYALNVGGALIADGTAAQLIRFSSNTGGAWNRIYFDDPGADAVVDENYEFISGSILRYVTVDKASAGIVCNSATPYLSHITLTGGGLNCTPGTLTVGTQALPSTVLVMDSSIAGGLTVNSSAYIWRNTVTGGGVNVSGQASVLTNTVSGGISVGGGSTVQSNTAGGSINLSGSGLVSDNILSGGLSVGSSATVQGNTIANGNISAGGTATVLSNTIKGGGISVGDQSQVGGNNVENAAGWGVSASGNTTIIANRLVGNASGINVSSGLVQGNLIANSGGVGVQVGSATVVSNTLTANSGSAIVIASGTPVKISGNNLEGNKGQYDIENRVPKSSLMTVPAQRNWWGTTSSSAITKRIYDFNDDYTLGTVLYSPVLTRTVADAPAYVRAITLTPESPVGIQMVTFDVLFSRQMDPGSSPQLLASLVLSWTVRASMPTDRGYLGVAASNGKIYAIGGYGGPLSTVDEYDPAMDTWRSRTSMPTARGQLGVAAASNGKIYAIGGRNDHGPLSIVEEYDPATDTWRSRTSMPTARLGLAVTAASNGKIYAIGGGDCMECWGFATVEEYDPATDTWRTRTSMPTARYDLGVVAASNGKIYAIGGWNGGGPLSIVEEYDPATDTWRFRTSMPTARCGLGVAAASNGKIYAIGGGDCSARWSSATVEEYNPATDTWRPRTRMSTARGYLGVVAAGNGKIYAVGGRSDVGFFATMEELYPFETAAFYDTRWPSLNQYRTALDITSLFPRSAYPLTASGARGTDGIEIASYSGVTFTVDYAGYIADTTPPPAPIVTAQVTGATTISASWSAADPESAISSYRYAIGATPGGKDVVNWTSIAVTSVVRSGLNLLDGQTYYLSAQARNEGGLWSESGTSGVVAIGAPAVAIRRSGLDAVLSWPHLGSHVDHYQIYRSTNPYFTPGEGDSVRLLPDSPAPAPGSEVSYADLNAFSPPMTNYFYGVIAIGAGGQSSAVSRRVGTFRFTLQPGSQ